MADNPVSELLLGAHVPATGGLQNAIRGGHAFGCRAVQVFTSSPQMWRAKAVTPAMVKAFREAVEETAMPAVICHDSYLINLCAPDLDRRTQSINGLKGEIERCAAYGIDRVVSHMGAHMGQGEEVGLAAVAESIKVVLAETPESVTVCMETTAGQGSSLMAAFEHLAKVLELTGGHPRLAVCLDTCHVFAAGYDIRTHETYDATMAKFGAVVGFDRLKVIHVNDSKKAFGSRVDRHDNLGKGEIGLNAFHYLVKDNRLRGIPMVVETPIENEGHERDVALLRELAEKPLG